MPYVVIGTKVSLRSVSAGVARAGLPYFTAWPQTLGEQAQRVHLREYIYTTVDMAAVQLNIYPWIHGTSRLRKDGLRRTNSNRQFQSYGKLTNRRTDNKIRVVLV